MTRGCLFCGAALLVCLAVAAMGQTGQAPPSGSSPGAGTQSTPPTFPPGTAHQSSPDEHSTAKPPGKTRLFSGTIVKESTGFSLRVGELSYKLDDQNQASGYEGQSVRVFGKLDKQTNTIQVEKIERLSPAS